MKARFKPGSAPRLSESESDVLALLNKVGSHGLNLDELEEAARVAGLPLPRGSAEYALTLVRRKKLAVQLGDGRFVITPEGVALA